MSAPIQDTNTRKDNACQSINSVIPFEKKESTLTNPFMQIHEPRAWGPGSFEMAFPLIEATHIGSGMRVLEVGGGSGQIAATLAKYWKVSVVTLEPWTDGSEIRDVALGEGVENQVLPMRLKAQNLPFSDETFDAVISVGSFEMIGDERPLALAEIIRVSRAGAMIGIAEPMCRTDMAPEEIALLDNENHLEFQKCFRTVEWYSSLFHSFGLEVADAHYFSQSRQWWMEYRRTARISQVERELILLDNDRWIALGMVVGRKGE